MSKVQLLLGLGVGVGGSFSILQNVTDRRLMAFGREDDSERDSYRYQVLLYRRMWEYSTNDSSREFQIEKLAKTTWNSALLGLPHAISSAAKLVSGKYAEISEGTEHTPERKS